MPTVPILGPRYWAALCLASVFGADLGDAAAHTLGLGHWRGLPVLALLFALTYAASRRGPPAEGYYWVAIIIVRTAATNFADLQAHDIHLPFALLILGYAALLAALVALSRRELAAGLPRANLAFWAAMLVAGTLGTVAGDALSHGMAQGPAGSSAVMSAVLGAAFLVVPARRAAPLASFWLLVVLVRIWGTDIGDWLADRIGPNADLAASGACFAGLLLWPTYPRKTPINRESASPPSQVNGKKFFGSFFQERTTCLPTPATPAAVPPHPAASNPPPHRAAPAASRSHR